MKTHSEGSKRNRFVWMIVSLLIVASMVLAGCGSATEPGTTQDTSEPIAEPIVINPPPGATPAPGAEDYTPKAGGDVAGPVSTSAGGETFHTTGLPITDKPFTLKIVAQKAGPLTSNFSEMVLFQRLEPKTNVKVEWTNIAGADYQEKKNLILASGDLPDAFWNTGFSDNDIVTYGGNGTLIPLEELIDQYAPNLKEIFKKRPEIRKAITAPDGHIYTLPMVIEFQDIGATPFFFSINKAWLDKLGMQVPTTFDELHDVLVAFKTQDPNGNGKADEIPFSFIFNFWCADIGDWFGAFNMPDNLNHRIVRDGKVIFTATQPEYKEALAYFHEWYAEGLIDPESFTQDAKIYLAKGKTEEVTLGSYIWWETEEVVGPERASDYVLVAPLEGPSGVRLVGHSNGSPYGRSAFAITSVNKNPEITMRWVDLFYDPYTSAQVIWGPLGIIYDVTPEGLLINKPLPEGVSMGEYRQTVAPEGIGIILSEDFASIVDMEPRAKQRINDLNTIYKPHMEDEWYPGPFFTPEELETLSTLETDIINYVNQQRATWLVDGGVEKDWDSYIDTLKRMGLDDMMKIYQDALDRYNASQ
jgi:putative aldouronate transport system substrate-binding protein